MATIPKKRAARKHNPEILRFRKIARAIGVPWEEVCSLRDSFRDIEAESRYAEESARQAGWIAHCRLNGWSEKHHAYWRGGFLRYYAKRIAKGCDHTSIPHYDQIAASVREQCAEWTGADTADIFEMLLSEYEPRQPATAHYSNALAQLCQTALVTENAPF